MTTLDNFVQATDLVCGCLPLVSTIVNGAELIYRLAHRVDAVANPVSPGLKTEMQIHILNKNMLNLWIGLVPIVGNLFYLFNFLMKGFVNQLIRAAVCNNTEVVQLCLANNHLGTGENARQILCQAALRSNAHNFRLILGARNDWTFNDVVTEGLRSCWSPRDDASHAANAITLLDYLATHFPGKTVSNIPGQSRWFNPIQGVAFILKGFVEAGQAETAMRILSLIPPCDFEWFEEILRDHVFSYKSFSNSSYERAQVATILPEDLRNAILDKCNTCSFAQLMTFFSSISQKRAILVESISQHQDHDTILAEHDQVLSDVARCLVQKVSDEPQPATLIQELTKLFSWREKKFLEFLLAKFEGRLSPDNKLQLLKDVRISYSGHGVDYRQQQSELFEFLLRYFQDSLSGDQILALRDAIAAESDFAAQLSQDQVWTLRTRIITQSHLSLAEVLQQGVPCQPSPFNKMNTFLKVFPNLAPAANADAEAV